MRKINSYFSIWHTLLFVSLIIMGYLVTTHISEALTFSSSVTYFNQNSAEISWSPSRGSVSYYVLEITDAHYLSLNNNSSVLTAVKEVRSSAPFYQLSCKNNHSYQVAVKAVSHNGFSSGFSPPSTLFICDQERPEVILDPLPSFRKLTSPNISITGSYRELNLSSISINGLSASINPFTKTFSRNISLAPGINQITLVAKDLAGNISIKELQITYSPANTSFYDPKENSHPFAVDYNNDGKMDLLLGSDDGKISVYINRGEKEAPLFNDHWFLTATDGKVIDVGSRAVPCIADMNGDGLMDLLVGSGEGYLYYCENEGIPTKPLFGKTVLLEDVKGTPIKVDSNSAPCVVDWDDDSTMEILLGCGNGTILLCGNEGDVSNDLIFSTPAHLAVEGLSLKVEANSIPFVADWDNDGGKDLLIGDNGGYLHLYLNSVENGDPDLMVGEKVYREDYTHVLEKELAIPYFIGMGMSKLML